MHKLPVFLIALFVLSCSASPDTTYEVSLKAGAVDRHATPVSAMIEASAATETTPVCVRSDTHEQPGQVHRTAEEQTEVWWLADLPAGEAATYTLDLGSDCSEEAFTWSESAGDATQLSFSNRPVIEYVHPTYDPDVIDETLKPFHHVFAPDGSQLLTKGAGGLYPHHRGIFFGYNRIEVNDQELNTWGSGNGEHQSHEEIVERFAGPVFGGHTVRIEWKDRSGEPFIEELRTLRVFRQSDDALLVDFSSRLEPCAVRSASTATGSTQACSFAPHRTWPIMPRLLALSAPPPGAIFRPRRNTTATTSSTCPGTPSPIRSARGTTRLPTSQGAAIRMAPPFPSAPTAASGSSFPTS